MLRVLRPDTVSILQWTMWQSIFTYLHDCRSTASYLVEFESISPELVRIARKHRALGIFSEPREMTTWMHEIFDSSRIRSMYFNQGRHI